MYERIREKLGIDILPLLAEHFQDRYADQRWIIYDLTRKYGLYYDLEKTEEIELGTAPQMHARTCGSICATYHGDTGSTFRRSRDRFH
jgi:hypothetical protein